MTKARPYTNAPPCMFSGMRVGVSRPTATKRDRVCPCCGRSIRIDKAGHIFQHAALPANRAPWRPIWRR